MGSSKFAPEEALVVFSDSSVRDSVIGSSGKLAGMYDQNRNNAPTAGIRIVVPTHLRSTEKQLSDYGRRIRSKHGKGTKTHVKFDDRDYSIYLNIKMKEDTSWSKVYPEYARDWLWGMKSRDAEAINKRFNQDRASPNHLDERGTRSTSSVLSPRSNAWESLRQGRNK